MFGRLCICAVLATALFLSAWGEDKVIDVNMPSPFVPLPFNIEFVKHPLYYTSATGVEGRVRQDFGPQAEVMTAYRTPDKSWAVWTRLPDQTGEYVFSKENETARLTVSEDPEMPYVHRVVVQRMKSSSGVPENVETILIQRAVVLPLVAPIKQLSGPATELLPDKAEAGKVWTRIPDQVCTMVFESEGSHDRAVVRVWADKDNRCFVSGRTGDDANSGTEDKPFKTLFRAAKFLKDKSDRRGGIYMAGGEYDLGSDDLILDYRISLFGGFDENGWRRDPIVTAPVLLPNGFRENWVDDITDRHKDLRRAEPRYRETVILRRTTRKMHTLVFGGGGGPGTPQVAGSPDTYIDGVTIYGPDENSRSDGATSLATPGQNKRTIRNCMIIHFCGAGHDRIMDPGGDGRVENTIVQGGIDSTETNNRPQLVGSFGHWHRNLLIGPTGGVYTRIINLWGEGGTFTENQIHGGESFGWTGMQAAHRSMLAERVHVFRKNVFYLDYLFNPFWSTGLVMEENEIHLFKGGVLHAFMASKALTIRNNDFHLAPGVNKDNLWPAAMSHRLGGKLEMAPPGMTEDRYVEPENGGTGAPMIVNNQFSTMEKPDRRAPTLIDLKKLAEQITKVGNKAVLRPKDSAKHLRAQAADKGTVSLAWEESADTDVVGYLVRYGRKSNSYLNPTFFGKVNSAQIKDLQPGTWHFTVVPIKEGNVECWKLSNEVEVVVQQ